MLGAARTRAPTGRSKRHLEALVDRCRASVTFSVAASAGYLRAMSKRRRKLAFAVGDTVNVARSMGAYSHRSGGVGKITAINPDGSYKLRYIAGGGRTRFEKAIAEKDLTKWESMGRGSRHRDGGGSAGGGAAGGIAQPSTTGKAPAQPTGRPGRPRNGRQVCRESSMTVAYSAKPL